jgi:MEMO1 family protein
VTRVRPPAVAGTFYPRSAAELAATVDRLLAAAAPPEDGAGEPAALIAPHAGYVYSGPVAASAFRLLAPARERPLRVVLLGPSHFVPFRGLALPAADAFATPLGEVPIDREAAARAAALPQVTVRDDAHAAEHSLEVHLPFLQRVLERFSIVPLVVGDAGAAEVGEVIEALWDGAGTLIDVSSDLSHYLDYATARRRDRRTCDAIERFADDELAADDACGRNPIRGLLWAARRRGLAATTLDLRSSGDTAGPKDRVVGYGSWVFRAAVP